MPEAAPPGAPGGPDVPTPQPGEPSVVMDPADPADRAPTPEDIAASAPEPPPSEADVLAATNPEPTPPSQPPPPVDTQDNDRVETWPEATATPPYSGWTRHPGVAVSGMGGRELLRLDRTGVRVEVLAQDGERLNIQCIGCPAPWENTGGWVALQDIQPMGRALTDSDPLRALLPERIAWGRGADRVPAGLSRDGLCQLADRGYVLEDGVAVWGDATAALTAAPSESGWQLDTQNGPRQTDILWRCPLTAPGS